MRITPPRRRAVPSKAAPLAGCLCALLATLALPAAAQDAAFQQASACYRAANLECAIDGFVRIAADPAGDRVLRRQALQYLGSAYVGRKMMDEAREAMADLIELEPPIIELDPAEVPPPVMRIYYDVRKEHEQGTEIVERRPDQKATLAVIDFTNSSLADDFEKYAPLEKGFASMMINHLSGASDLKVVERERIQWLIQEHDLARSGKVDQQTAVRAGKLLGARAVLIGAYTVAGNRMWLSTRLVDVETGEILNAEQITGKPGDFFELVDKLSQQVLTSWPESLKLTQTESPTQSLDAMLAFSEGLALLEQDDYAGARAKFQRAHQLDPSYEEARKRAESLTPILATR